MFGWVGEIVGWSDKNCLVNELCSMEMLLWRSSCIWS